MGNIVRVHIAAAVLASFALGGAASAFADSYYQGADPNPTYINQVRQHDGQVDHSSRTGSVGNDQMMNSGASGAIVSTDRVPDRGDYYQGANRP